MIKRHIIETVKEYDETGVLKNETITETNEEDDSVPQSISFYGGGVKDFSDALAESLKASFRN